MKACFWTISTVFFFWIKKIEQQRGGWRAGYRLPCLAGLIGKGGVAQISALLGVLMLRSRDVQERGESLCARRLSLRLSVVVPVGLFLSLCRFPAVIITSSIVHPLVLCGRPVFYFVLILKHSPHIVVFFEMMMFRLRTAPPQKHTNMLLYMVHTSQQDTAFLTLYPSCCCHLPVGAIAPPCWCWEFLRDG